MDYAVSCILKGRIPFAEYRLFCTAELVSSDHDADTHAIGTTFRSFLDMHYSSPPADKCMCSFPWGHDPKPNFLSYTKPPADPEVKTVSRNIACPPQNRMELLEVGLKPDFNLKG